MKLTGVVLLFAAAASAQAPLSRSLDSLDGLKAHKTAIAAATHQGAAAECRRLAAPALAKVLNPVVTMTGADVTDRADHAAVDKLARQASSR